MPWPSKSRESLSPPSRRRLQSVADVAWRLHCTRKALQLWMEERSLERDELRAMWMPFRGFVGHVILLVCINMTCLAHLDHFMYHTQDALRDFYSNNHFPDGPVAQMITLTEVDTAERLWSFLDYLVDATGEVDPPGITPENPILGRIRLRQVRVRVGPCGAAHWPDLARRFRHCFGFLRHDNQDTAPFGPGGEAWTYRDDSEGNMAYGYLFSYSPGGYWIDLPRSGDKMKEAVKALKALTFALACLRVQDADWVDAATRAVMVELSTYNFNCNQLCGTSILLELPPGGGVVPLLFIRCTTLMSYATAFDFWRLGNEILFIIGILHLTGAEVYQAIMHRKDFVQKMTGKSYPMYLMMVLSSWLVAWIGLRRFDEASRLLLSMQQEGLAASQRTESFIFLELGCVRILAVVVFTAWLRTFQYHRVTTQVLVTLQRSRFDLTSYFIIYVLLHCSFAQAGYYFFGDKVSPFKTFSESSLAILAMALGEMRSDVFLASHWVTGPIYFFLIIFIVIFVFHNMFFVILSYNYDSVREERSQLDRGVNFRAFLKNGYLNLAGRERPYDPQEDMQWRLIRCGFSPGSLQAFKALLHPKQRRQIRKLQPDMASVKDLNELETQIDVMEKEILLAKSELSSLVSSLESELYGT